MTASPAQVAAGKSAFRGYCIGCHGDSAIGNGFTPDLRVSGALANAPYAWKGVVIGGALKDRGMVKLRQCAGPRRCRGDSRLCHRTVELDQGQSGGLVGADGTLTAQYLGTEMPPLPAPWAAASFRFKFLAESPRFANWHGF